LIKESENNLQ